MYIQNQSHYLDYQRLDGSIIQFPISMQHTIVRKFDLVFKQVNVILDMDDNFHILYDEFLTIMNDVNSIDFERVKEILPQLIEYIDKYAEQLHYWDFSYTAPKKLSEFKLHIDQDGYLQIMKASVRCKFICVPVVQLREEHMQITRYIYNMICKEMIESGVQFKLERIIDSIVLSTAAKGLDAKSQLWVFFSTSKGIDPQNLALRERNAIFYKGLPTIATGRDPIKWFVSMSRTSVSFQMKDKINETQIVFSAPIESCYENSSDMLKVFIYEEVTSNRKLRKLFKEFPFALDMIKEYVYPITNWISAPFISKVFNVSNLNITHLINILLLNIYAYKFLRDQENDWILFRMLTYKVNVKGEEDVENTSFKYPIPMSAVHSKELIGGSNIFTTKHLLNIIHSKLEELKFIEHTIYTESQLEDLFKIAIKTLLSYDYYDSKGNKVTIDPVELSLEYIEYIFNILTNKYDEVIVEARNFLRD